MPALVNSRHEAFARAIVKGGTGKDAYIKAGYSAAVLAAEAHASRLLRNGRVAARIAELKAAAAKSTIISAQETLERISGMAANEEIGSIKLRALELMGKHHKLFTEKLDVTGTITLEALIAESYKP